MGKRARAGFTLVEMMVAVSILGVLTATAIPAFSGMVARSKTSEVSANLNSMFKLASAYYLAERSSQGHSAAATGYCSVDDGGPEPAIPLPRKQKPAFGTDPSFRALGFSIADFTYFSYGLASKTGTGSCANEPNTPELYTFFAHGDLDGDGLESTFELSAGSDSNNVLYHSRSYFISQEIE
ncbi:MAG TPA: prepilin-type N-terminal cleavage/methylation domain-containing protein [Polyangiales bacterium]|nr:prepilin-type N-terminal cleavage/methylation domain-containing protein [Polyangiales bacterium]